MGERVVERRPRAALSRRAHVAAATVDNEKKELDSAGVVLAVVVHCKCFVEYKIFFTSYSSVSFYLVQLSVTLVTHSFI